jgi:transcription antitermination factor NusG
MIERPRSPENFSWLVLRVPGSRELAAEKELLEEDIAAAFCPVELRMKRMSRYASRQVLTAQPRYSSYIFAGMKRVDDWPELFRSRLVKAVLGFGTPIAVSRKVMEKVFSVSGQISTDVVYRPLVVGSEVSVLDGPFAEFVGRVEELRPRDAKVDLKIFGRVQSVVMPLEYLKPACA